MAPAKNKKPGQGKKIKSPRVNVGFKRADAAMALKQDIVIKHVLTGLLFIYLLYYLFQLYASLDNTLFWADENKHAYLCSVVYKTHQIPAILPDDLYGEYRWSYPPLFHILGAAFMGIAGSAGLKFFNLVLLIVFLPAFYFLIRKHYGNNAAVVAGLLMTLAPVLAINTIRLTTEMLSMLCIFFSAFFLTIALRKTDKFYAVICGFSTGLLTLSKQAGFVVVGFYGLLCLWFFWNNKENFKILLWVLAVTVATYSPYLVWALYHKIEVFGFVSVFLGLTDKPQWSATALKSFRQHDSGIVEFAHLFYRASGFALTSLLLLPLLHFARVRFKDAPQNYVFFLSIYLALVMMVWHITNDRHTIILLPLIAFLIGYSFVRIVTHRLMRQALIVLLLLICGYFSYHLPDYRQQYNAPKEFVDVAELIKEDAAPDFKVLGLRKFDTIMYTQKRVIWPHPKLREIPIDIVKKQSADKLFEVLKKYQIKYILIETPLIIKSDQFYARSYPLYFVRSCERLERRGKLSFVAMTKSRRYILLRVV